MISKHFIVTLFFASLFLIGYIFQSYILSITVGAILAIATRPIYETVSRSFHLCCTRAIASSLLTLSLFLVVFLPLIYFVSLSYQFIPKISADQTMDYMQNVLSYIKNLPKPFDIFQDSVNALLGEFNINSIDVGMIKSLLDKFAQFFFKVNAIVYQFFLILFFYFLFNLYGYTLFTFVSRTLPMVKEYKRILYDELSSTISSVFFGSLFSMILQGVAFGIFIYAFSDYDAIYLGMATGFLTAIPVVGTYIVALPLAVVELLNQNYFFAGMILLFAVVVLSGVIDNFLRLIFMKFLNKRFSLNYSLGELFILLAMLGGVGVFGGWGLIIAPAILSLCMGVFRIYKKSHISKSFYKKGGTDGRTRTGKP